MSVANYLAPMLAVFLASGPAFAERADRDKPMNIEADSARLDDLKKYAIYEGRVILSQGTLSLTADRVEVRQDAGGFVSGTAVGSPVQFRQKLEGRDEYAQGWADQVEYDARQELIKLQGNARLKKGDEELRGGLIVYNARSELFQASGNQPGQSKGRVKAVIMPKGSSNSSKAAP